MGPPVLLLILAAFACPASAQPRAPLFKLEATLDFGAPVGAVAISADESLIATATGTSGALVVISDRRSATELGKIASEAGAAPRLAFSPVSDLLLVAGTQALELWEVPIEPLKAGQALPQNHLRWRVPVDSDIPLGSAGFGSSPGMVVWTAGNAIYRRATSAGSAYSGEPARSFPASQQGPLAVAARAGANGIAVRQAGAKSLTLLDPRSLKDRGSLSGHRFPVVSAHYSHGKALISLDSGYNLARWKANGQPVFINYLDPPDSSLVPRQVLAIAKPHYLIVAGSQDKATALIYNSTDRKIHGVLKGVLPGAIAVSPTGRYIAAGKGEQVRLFGFALPLSPRSYVNGLKALNAHKTARNYAAHLDERGLPKNFKANLLAEMERSPGKLGLQDFLNSLALAEQEGNLDEMAYWAEKVLAVEQNHPAAVAALNRVRDIRDARVISQAGKAMELGEHRQVIALLSSKISADSPHYGKALEIIRLAEQARSIETALEQARDKMNLGNYPAAQALVNQVLRKAEDHEAALELEEEIAGRQGGFNFEPLTFLLVALLAVTMVAGVVFRLRRWLAPLFKGFSLSEGQAGWGSRRGERPSPVREPPGAERAREPPPHARAPRRDAPPRPQAFQRELHRTVTELYEKMEEMIRVSRQADIKRQYRSLLLELEAELSAIHRRLMERTGDFQSMRQRLEEMIARVRKLEFGQPRQTAEIAQNSTYYDILKLKPDASPSDIKAAYHRLLKEYHPDLHSGSDFGWVKAEAEKMSKKLSEAYDVLSDTVKREQYNRDLGKKGS
ncbi:MAG: J domain-containing protein [SAR324 cluster bacterium]|nr:J domain-containing protein [SAR324 cluster bacterium]